MLSTYGYFNTNWNMSTKQVTRTSILNSNAEFENLAFFQNSVTKRISNAQSTTFKGPSYLVQMSHSVMLLYWYATLTLILFPSALMYLELKAKFIGSMNLMKLVSGINLNNLQIY